MTLKFLSFVRQGAGALITQSPTQGRVTLPLELRFNNDTLTSAVTLTLAGPADAAGLLPRAIAREYPRAGANSAHPGDLPYLEFAEPDLPWRFTPAPPSAAGRLTPWLALVILEPTEIEGILPAGGTRKLSILRVKSGTMLPDPSTAWSRAHAQSTSDDTPATSRILAQRALEPARAYQAFLVPTFESGRLAGLGQPVPPNLDPLLLVLPASTGVTELPVYYQWEFRTGQAPEFETLVRALKPFPLPATVGATPVALDGEPAAIAIESALLSPAMTSAPLPAAAQQRFRAQLTKKDDAPAPPIYGARAKGLTRIDDPAAPQWVRDLNTDPRYRAAAGLGARVIEREQEAFVTEAWRQAGEVTEVSTGIRHAQFGATAATRLHRQFLKGRPADRLVWLTAPSHASALTKGRTIASTLETTAIPQGALSANLRRLGERRVKPRAKLLVNANKVQPPRARAQSFISWRDTLDKAGLAGRIQGKGKTGPQLTPEFLTIINRAAPAAKQQRPIAKLDELSTDILAKSQPLATNLAPVTVQPEYDRATYHDLAAISPEWLLRGLAGVPHNCVSLARSNARFIEAFLVGLNDEFARELDWRDFPLDPTATFFRHFWSAATAEIAPIKDWTGPLGTHLTGTAEPLVLVLRGELVTACPDVQIFAVPAILRDGKRTPSQDAAAERLPLFCAKAADTIFAGFDLAPTAVTAEPGWYFVLQEGFDAPRFQPTNRTPAAAATSADIAFDSLKRPARVAVHASTLIGTPEQRA